MPTVDLDPWNNDGTLGTIDRFRYLVKLSGGEVIALERL
jgi:long-subunit acyl-CoA synthetase (AMP-forming)